MAFYSDFAGHYDTVFPVREATVAFLEDWLPGPGPVLDIGCGPGGHLRRLLAGGGRTGTGIDIDPGMIDAALRRDPEGDYRLMGMEDLGHLATGSYVGCYCIGNVLPHLPAGRLAGFLREVRRVLAPGGCWIVQTVNFDPLLDRAEHVFPPLRVADGAVVFQRAYRDIRPGRLVFATRLEIDGRERFSARTDLHPLTSAAYRAAHEAAGFRLLTHAADWKGRPFDPGVESGSIFAWESP